MRRISKKRQAINRKIKPMRDAFLKSGGCQICLRHVADHVHEIARGPAREKAIQDPCTWLRLCLACHEAVDDYSKWPVSKQLAVKLIRDPRNFDLARFNDSRGQRMDMEDVMRHLEVR